MKIAQYHSLPSGLELIRTLGRGGEGTVYLASRHGSAQRYVMKVFHAPLPKAWAVGLRLYADRISSNDHGLLPIKLWETQDEILGVYYPYAKYCRVHGRIVASCERIARSFVGLYCQLQYYLMSYHGIGLLEPSLDHLMLSRSGKLCYIDFGYGISTLDHGESIRLDLFGYGFAAFLVSLYGWNLRAVVPLHEGHSYSQPCPYFSNALLDEVASGHKWMEAVISEVRSSPASALRDPEFYRGFAAQLPDHLAAPVLVIGASNLLHSLGRLRRAFRRAPHR